VQVGAAHAISCSATLALAPGNNPVGHASFGDLLRTHRLKLGLTQEGVTERAGLSVHAIQKLERGATHPYRDTTNRLVEGDSHGQGSEWGCRRGKTD
jgi:DNA-binding XRE family transcriptional regulator